MKRGRAVVCMGQKRRHTKFRPTTIDGRDNLEDIGNNMMIILKYN
jgi:hypothetical protein